MERGDSAPKVNIVYEEFGSLRACPDDTLLESVIVEDGEKTITYTHCIYTENLERSVHGYYIRVYNKLANKKHSIKTGGYKNITKIS